MGELGEVGAMREVASGLRFPEGPVATGDGSVLVVEIAGGTIARIGPGGELERVADCGGGPNGAAMGPDGKLYVANSGGWTFAEVEGLTVPSGEPPEHYIGGRIQRVDLDTGEVEDLYEDCAGRAFRGPNDLVFDADGGFYFTDHGKTTEWSMDRGALYYARADGSGVVEAARELQFPNGVGLSPDGRRAYVAETWTGRVWSWEVAGPGELRAGGEPFTPGGATLLHGFEGFQLLDSLGVDSEGNVCVATLVRGGITSIAPDAGVVEYVDVPGEDPLVTNICWGGEDMRTAFVTSSGRGRLYAAEWPVPGLDLNF
jgi:gluconolactonase